MVGVTSNVRQIKTMPPKLEVVTSKARQVKCVILGFPDLDSRSKEGRIYERARTDPPRVASHITESWS